MRGAPLLVVAALVVFSARPAYAKCAPSATGGVSENGRFEVKVDLDGKFSFWSKDEKGEPQKQHEGKLAIPGHHVKTLVADTGKHFVLHDTYEGVSVFEASGKLVKRLEPAAFLDKDELAKRPGKWACHSEGTWSKSLALVEGGAALSVNLAFERTVAVELATGKLGEAWVVPGVCKTPDMVKAHGGMNCIVQEWTCPRCKKKQNDLVWNICRACAKELDVCIVCQKKRAPGK